MQDSSKYRSVLLADYLIEQGVGSDPRAQADTFSKIYSGDLPAFLTIHPLSLPVGSSTSAVLRHAMSTAGEPREVPALSHAKAKAEIRKAALGRDADSGLLANLTLLVPITVVEESAPEGEERPGENSVPTEAIVPIKRKIRSVNDERAEIILKAIEEAGVDRYAINKPPKGKREGDRSKVWRKVPHGSMEYKDFDNAWCYMLNKRIIRYQDATSPTP